MKCSTRDCIEEATHGEKCRDCYEDGIRREMRDAYDRDMSVRKRMMLHKERCSMRLRKNYDGGNEHA